MKWILLVLVVVNMALAGLIYRQAAEPSDQSSETSVAQLNNLSLSEATLAQLQQLTLATPEVVEPQSSPSCVMIENFVDAAQMNSIRSRLDALEMQVVNDHQNEVLRTDYWVVLGPFKNRAEASGRLAELQRAQIDSFLISRGPLAGAISLGLFSNQVNAERRLVQLADSDIKARIEPSDRTRSILRLRLPAKSMQMISESGLSDLLSDFPGVTQRRFSC